MKKVVLRYTIGISSQLQTIRLPVRTSILSCAFKPGDDTISMWTLEPDTPLAFELREFFCVGTGPQWKIETPARYIGTCPHRSGLVWHVFEQTK